MYRFLGIKFLKIYLKKSFHLFLVRFIKLSFETLHFLNKNKDYFNASKRRGVIE